MFEYSEVNFISLLRDLASTAQKKEPMNSTSLCVKLGEKVGHFNQRILQEHGYLQHEEKNSTTFEEGASVINSVIQTLAKEHMEMSPMQITNHLFDMMQVKGKKYERILKDGED